MKAPKITKETEPIYGSAEALWPPINSEATHILVVLKSTDQEDLYGSDGMLIASRQKDIVRFGFEPKVAGNRLFINSASASVFLKRLARARFVIRMDSNMAITDITFPEDMPAVVMETRDAEQYIHLPHGAETRTVIKH